MAHVRSRHPAWILSLFVPRPISVGTFNVLKPMGGSRTDASFRDIMAGTWSGSQTIRKPAPCLGEEGPKIIPAKEHKKDPAGAKGPAVFPFTEEKPAPVDAHGDQSEPAQIRSPVT